MKAIETEYKGYKFRSRLEARWAVFFDALGVKWEYESEGYELEDGTKYLPDFYFPTLDYYAEVKGKNEHLQEDIEKAEKFVRSSKKTLVIFSQIPYSELAKGLYFFPEIYYTSQISEKHLGYCYMNFEKLDNEVLVVEYLSMVRHKNWRNGTWRYRDIDRNETLWSAIQPVCGEKFDCDEFEYRDVVDLSMIQKAILQARQARFEHGEQPFVNSENIELESIEDKLEKLYDICDTSTESGRIDFLKKASNIIAEEKSQLSREVYIQSVCKKSNMPIQILKTEVDVIVKRNRLANKYNRQHHTDSEDRNTRKAKRAEELIIYYMLKRPQEWEDVEKAIPPDSFVTPFHKKVYSALLDKMRDVDKFDILMLNGEFTQEEMGRISGIAAKSNDLPITFEGVLDCAELLKKFKPTPSKTDNELMNLFRSKNSKE